MLSWTGTLVATVAVGSIVVGVVVQRLAAWYLGYLDSDDASTSEGGSEKPMTYAEAVAASAKLAPTSGDVEEGQRRRRPKRKSKPELVTLSMLRYGEYSTDDSRLTIQAWRPDASHRLAGHIVVDIIPKQPPPSGSLQPASVRRLAIDLETVEAARVVALADGEAVVLAVSDYEVKGQGIIFSDLQYDQGVGIDDTTLYIVLIIRNIPTLSADEDKQRKAEFRRLARGLAAAKADVEESRPAAELSTQSPVHQPETTPLVRPLPEPADPPYLRRLPSTTVAQFFSHAFRSVL